MPRGDRTGPAGMGPMTGGGFGHCGGYRAPGFATQANWGGRGFGRGGGGYGHRHRFFATGIPGWQWAGPGGPWGGAWDPYWTARPEQDAAVLRAEAERLEQAAADMRGRAAELETRQDQAQVSTRGE